MPANARRRGLNENYAREIMELHTLGVDGGYTQQDVHEVARCFTGWTLLRPRGDAEFHFEPRLHDQGAKTVLGTRIPAGGGIDDGMKVIDLLARHPATAKFIATKLARRFVERRTARGFGQSGRRSISPERRRYPDRGSDDRRIARIFFSRSLSSQSEKTA